MKQDYTRMANKILKVILPEEFKYIKDINVTECYYSDEKMILGSKYHMNKRKFLVDITLYLEEKYVIEMLGDVETLTDKQIDFLYGDNFVENVRETMFKALNLLGVKFSHFEKDGTISFEFI